MIGTAYLAVVPFLCFVMFLLLDIYWFLQPISIIASGLHIFSPQKLSRNSRRTHMEDWTTTLLESRDLLPFYPIEIILNSVFNLHVNIFIQKIQQCVYIYTDLHTYMHTDTHTSIEDRRRRRWVRREDEDEPYLKRFSTGR